MDVKVIWNDGTRKTYHDIKTWEYHTKGDIYILKGDNFSIITADIKKLTIKNENAR